MAVPGQASPRGSVAARPRVLVIGAGFGGLAAVRGLASAPVDITVLDRTKEPGAIGEPLYLDVRAAVGEALEANSTAVSGRITRMSGSVRSSGGCSECVRSPLIAGSIS